MNRWTSLAIVAVAAAAGTAAVAGADTTPKVTTSTFTATAVVDSGTNVDNPPAGDTAGDVLAFTQKLYAKPDQKTVVGSDQAYCVRTVPGSGRVCTGIFYLDKGELTITGPESTKLHSLAITGGTGGYKGATGYIVLRPRGDTIDDMTFHVTK